MSLKEKINEELKKAMISKEQVRLDTIRSIRSEILKMDKSGMDREMTEDEEIQLLNKQAKMRRESIEQFKAAGREDLAENESAQLKIIEEFLPAQMSDEEAGILIDKIIFELSDEDKSDFGKVMSAAMKELKGKVDGKLVQTLVKLKVGS